MLTRTRAVLALSLTCASLALTLSAQQRAQNGSAQFEAASVRQNVSDGPSFLATKGDRFSATNFSLRLLILNAFRLQANQLVGGPGWLDDHYDIVAKSPQPLTSDTQREMIRALLADRFKFAAHMETRELPIYALVVARADGKLGPQISVSKNDCAGRTGSALSLSPPQGRPVCDWFGRPGSMTAGGVRIGTLVEMLSRTVGRQVFDRTGLTGFYDFDLTFTTGAPPPASPTGAPPASSDADAPSIFTALQEQLGLKLDAARGPVDVLVIDRIERPTLD